MMSLRAGPLDTMVMGTPMAFSANSTYLRAFSGRSSYFLMPVMSHFQPGSTSKMGLHRFSWAVGGKVSMRLPSSS